MPVILQPMFGACNPSEDEAALEIEKNGTRVFTANLVWALNSEGESSLQVNSPFGDTIVEMKVRDGQWSAAGQFEMKVTETRDGLINVQSYDVPLKSSELGCILAGVWPVEWLRWLDVAKDDRQIFRIEGSDGQRSIRIDMTNDVGGAGFAKNGRLSCAFFSWGGFLGFFQRQAKLCREKMSQGTTLKLTGINNYSVNWITDNGD